MSNQQNLKSAYQWMLNFVKTVIHETEDGLSLKMHYLIDTIKDKAYELNEYTREEIDTVADYLQRDISDAVGYLSDEGRELKDWLKFDVELIEERLLDQLKGAINTTNIELEQLSENAEAENLWYQGEVSGPGSFVCQNCGQTISLFHIQELPECPQCKQGMFKRISK